MGILSKLCAPIFDIIKQVPGYENSSFLSDSVEEEDYDNDNDRNQSSSSSSSSSAKARRRLTALIKHYINASTESASGCALFTLVTAFTGVWAVSVAKKNVSIVDSCWGTGFLLSAAVYALHPENGYGSPTRKRLLLCLTTLWSLRLSGYITWRNYGHKEDYRYAALRKRFGSSFWFSSLFSVFWFQALLCWIISQPLRSGMKTTKHSALNEADFIGIIVWALGFFFETVGDYQLAAFKSVEREKGSLLTTGLWKYTRHPNYFGDTAVWWGLYLIGGIAPGGTRWRTIFSPLLMNFLLLRVSGVSLLEKSLTKRKAGYEDYMKNTSAFLPWPPKG